MDSMDWPGLIRALMHSGVSQPAIAEHCLCRQSTISELLHAKTRDPRFSLGRRLLALAKSRGVSVPAVDVLVREIGSEPAGAAQAPGAEAVEAC